MGKFNIRYAPPYPIKKRPARIAVDICISFCTKGPLKMPVSCLMFFGIFSIFYRLRPVKAKFLELKTLYIENQHFTRRKIRFSPIFGLYFAEHRVHSRQKSKLSPPFQPQNVMIIGHPLLQFLKKNFKIIALEFGCLLVFRLRFPRKTSILPEL